jgi:ATP-dependent helicase/DNAse subunit B
MKKISYSQFSLYHQCPHRWKLDYVDGLRTYEQSIHTLFGTVMHETIQTWLTTIYQQSVKAGNAMDFGQMLKEGLANGYKQSIQEGQSHYSTPQQLSEFYHDGITILEYLRKKRTAYFTTKNIKLVGVEIPLTLQMKNNVQFVGFIDLVMYDEKNDKVKIYDIKTSTGGWNKYQKADIGKTAQLVLYKEYYAKQFNVDVERVDVEYIILRRKIDEELEFTPKRIQTFTPASGKPTRNKVVKLLEGFIDACFTSNGEYKVDANHLAIKQKLCNYCPYSNNEQACPKKQRISL